MLYNFYQFVHNSFGICFWELPTLLIALIMVIMELVHHHNQKKREENFEKQKNEKLKELNGGQMPEDIA